MDWIIWNPWHGCTKYSEGCRNCYVYRRDQRIGKDASLVTKTKDYDLPMRMDRSRRFKVPAGSHLYCCMTSDFFLDKADPWRKEVWDMIRLRNDLCITIITKRVERVRSCLPPDWGDGWEHVTLCVTMENQQEADRRLPLLIGLPFRHKEIICEPILGPIRFSLPLTRIEQVTVGGESGEEARPCNYDWVLSIRKQCISQQVSFFFKQTGYRFIKDGKGYLIGRSLQQSQARKASIDYVST